ncbi:dentin matrix acidic phosphoprotein 1 [Thomomys bottae]
MKTSILFTLLWGLSCALPVARYQNTESESTGETGALGHLAQLATPSPGSSESSEESQVSSEEQTSNSTLNNWSSLHQAETNTLISKMLNLDSQEPMPRILLGIGEEPRRSFMKAAAAGMVNDNPSDSAETVEHLDSDDGPYIYRPASGLSKSTGTGGHDKEDDEDDSGDDTFGDEDHGLGPEEGQEGGISRLDSDEDSADTTQSHEDSTQDTSSEELNSEDEDRLAGGDLTQESESEEPHMGGVSDGGSSHGDGSEFDDEGMQSDDPDSTGSERGHSRMSSAGLRSKELKGVNNQVSTHDSGDRPSVEYPSRKFFSKSQLSEELAVSHSREEIHSDSVGDADSKAAGLSQSWEDSKNDSPEDTTETQSQEDSQELQDSSSESSQEEDLPSQESSSESQEEVVNESRGDNPDTSQTEQRDSDSNEEESFHTFSSSESESREEQADGESTSSEESTESSEDDISSSQEALQSQSASAESQSQESQSEEEADSDSQDSSRSQEDSSSRQSTSSSEEDGPPKNMEADSRKLTVDTYHNKPIGDQDDNDCQDGY